MLRSVFLLMMSASSLAAQAVQTSDAAVMRVLDRVSGRVEDVDMAAGRSYDLHGGHLTALMFECRYHQDDPTGEAYVFVEVLDRVKGESVFSGWMIASSPALNALEDARYDLWPLRCKTS